MLKINKSILIICMISLFLIIGQISASDNDLMEISDPDANASSIELRDGDISPISSDADIENAYEEQKEQSEIKHMPREAENDILQLDENLSESDEDDDSIAIVEEREKDTTGVVMANDNYSCGPASLATALNKYGLNLSLNEVSKQTNTTENGTNMQSLIDAAEHYNFSACGIEIETKDLKENYIVHLNINGCEHWSVITKVTDSHVFLADSTEGNMNFTINEFNSYFTKKAVVVSNANSMDLKEQIISNNLTILDKSQCLSISGKGMKKKVIGYRIVWKYGLIQKYGWVLRPKVVRGHVTFSQWQYVKGYYTVWGKYKVKEPIYKYYYVSDEALTSAKIKKSR